MACIFLLIDSCLLLLAWFYMIEWAPEDGCESPKETRLSRAKHSAEFYGYLIDFRGFRKRYFLGFSLNLNACSLFVNPFYRFRIRAGFASRALERDA